MTQDSFDSTREENENSSFTPASDGVESSKVNDLSLKAFNAGEQKNYAQSIVFLTEALQSEPENKVCRDYLIQVVMAKWNLSAVSRFNSDNYSCAVARFNNAPKQVFSRLLYWVWASVLWAAAVNFACAYRLLQDLVMLCDPIGRKYRKPNDWKIALYILTFFAAEWSLIYLHRYIWMHLWTLIFTVVLILLGWASWVLSKNKTQKHLAIVWMLRTLVVVGTIYEVVSILRSLEILR